MLCQFTFKNYGSYKDETTIEMQAENIKEFEDTLLKSSKDEKKYLPLSVIYGPNGGGKSNALEALVCLIGNVLAPIALVKDGRKVESIPVSPYKFTEDKLQNTTDFEIFYRIDKNEYRYNISYLKGKIMYESLYILTENARKPTKIFIRRENEIELGEELQKEKVNTNNNLNIPFISFLVISYNIETINKAINFFTNISLINCSSEEFETQFMPLMFENDDVKKIFIKLLNIMDIDISDYRIEELPDVKDGIKIFTKHIINGKEYELNLLEESSGTQKLFALLPRIIFALRNGNLTAVDEMDAKLHPKLLRFIIELYKDKEINEKGAQIIFTSHDLTTMTKDVFRRDEILFACKNIENSSEIYSLYEIRDTNGEHIKTTTAYNKQYMEGRYGADPYLQKILEWEV